MLMYAIYMVEAYLESYGAHAHGNLQDKPHFWSPIQSNSKFFTMLDVPLFCAVHTLSSWMLGCWTAFWSACARTSSTSRRLRQQVEIHAIHIKVQERARTCTPKPPKEARWAKGKAPRAETTRLLYC